MVRQIKGISVYGKDVGENSQCAHWHASNDIVALKFPCCNRFYSCYECHLEETDHRPKRWAPSQFDREAILCGGCGHLLTIGQYLDSSDQCPNCESDFNPGCRTHHHLYFQI